MSARTLKAASRRSVLSAVNILSAGNRRLPSPGAEAVAPASPLDHRFGWRWLVPAGAATTRIVGFEDEETAFLRAAFAIEPDGHGARWIVDADRAAPAGTSQRQPNR